MFKNGWSVKIDHKYLPLLQYYSIESNNLSCPAPYYLKWNFYTPPVPYKKYPPGLFGSNRCYYGELDSSLSSSIPNHSVNTKSDHIPSCKSLPLFSEILV